MLDKLEICDKPPRTCHLITNQKGGSASQYMQKNHSAASYHVYGSLDPQLKKLPVKAAPLPFSSRIPS